MAKHPVPVTFQLLYANHDAAHCLAPGLFRSLKKGDREVLKLSVKYQLNEDTKIEFRGPDPLGVDDMRVLQGLVAMASKPGDHRYILDSDPKEMEGKQLRELLQAQFDARDQDGLVVKGSFRQLAREIGYPSPDGGTLHKTLKACVERLWAVSVIVEHKGVRQGFRILSQYRSDEQAGTLSVALNPRLTRALLHPSGGQYFRLDMNEVRGLTNDPARLIHQRLHWLNPGYSCKVLLDTLCSYVWPVEGNAETMKKRRQRIAVALADLESIGWSVARPTATMVNIRRPALKNVRAPAPVLVEEEDI